MDKDVSQGKLFFFQNARGYGTQYSGILPIIHLKLSHMLSSMGVGFLQVGRFTNSQAPTHAHRLRQTFKPTSFRLTWIVWVHVVVSVCPAR